MKVAIIGGTGAFGRALAKRLHEIGKDEVVVGSRDAGRAEATATELGVAGGRNQEVVAGDPGDALICGEDSDAKTRAFELAERLGARAIDAGPLANSRALEGMTSVILNVNKRYKAHAGIQLTGLP